MNRINDSQKYCQAIHADAYDDDMGDNDYVVLALLNDNNDKDDDYDDTDAEAEEIIFILGHNSYKI